MKRWILTILAVALVAGLYVQCVNAQVTTGTITIVVLGKDYDLEFWKIDGEYYVSLPDLMSAMPRFFDISDDGKLVTNEAAMLAAYNVLLKGTSATTSTSSGGTIVVESRIAGAFNGWTGDTLFELANGQVWKQAEYGYFYTYKYRPKVTIVRISTNKYVMRVEGVDKQIAVTRVE